MNQTRRLIYRATCLFFLPLFAGCGSNDAEVNPIDASSDSSAMQDDGADSGDPSDAGADIAETSMPDSATCRWSTFDDGLKGGAVATVAFHPTKDGPAFVAAGTSVFRAPAALASWEKLGDTPGGIREFAFSPTALDELYGASANGILHSKDGGKTWNVAGLSGVSLLSAFVHPAERLRVFAGTSGAGVFRSLDGGASWVGSSVPSVRSEFTSFTAPATSRDEVLASYIALNDAGGWSLSGGILRSTNGGASWTSVFDGGRVHRVVTCAAAPLTRWAATGAGLARSTDGGVTWSTVQATTYFTDVAVAGDTCGTLYATIYPTGVVRSDDGGATWTAPLGTGFVLEAGNRAPYRLAVSPTAPDRVAAATHGGLYSSLDRGALWSLAPGMLNLQAWRMATTPSALLMATYGTGLWSKPTSGTWSRLPGLTRDFVTGVFASPDGSTLFAAAGGLHRSGDGGATFANVFPQYVMAMAFDPSPSTIYVGTQTHGVNKSTDGGLTWVPTNTGLSAWPTAAGSFIDVRGVVIDPAIPTNIVIGTNGRGFFRTTDGGASWTATAAPFGMASVGSLIRSTKTGALFAQITGEGVARSEDFGATWTFVNSGLPTLNTVLIDDAATGDIYASSGSGLVVLRSGASVWTRVDDECTPLRGYGVGAVVSTGGDRGLVLAARGSVVRMGL